MIIFSLQICMNQILIDPPPGIQVVQSLDNIIHNVRILDTLFPCDGPGDERLYEHVTCYI